MLDAATRRLIPGPADDPGETSPGAHEANVVRYIDDMLAAFSFKVPKIFAGGPWSNRHVGGYGDHENYMKLTSSHSHRARSGPGGGGSPGCAPSPTGPR